MSIAVSAVISLQSSVPVTANHRLCVEAVCYCGNALQGRDYLFTETAMGCQGAYSANPLPIKSR